MAGDLGGRPPLSYLPFVHVLLAVPVLAIVYGFTGNSSGRPAKSTSQKVLPASAHCWKRPDKFVEIRPHKEQNICHK